MSLKYTPQHVCDFCGQQSTTLIVGISGGIQGGVPAEICPACALAARDVGIVDGPVKHPKAAEYEARELEEKQRAYVAQMQSQNAQQAVNVFGQVQGNEANLANNAMGDPYSGR